MIAVQLTGGLGNQMFQYAAAKSLSLYHQVPLLLDVSSFYRKDLPELEVPRKFELYHFKGVTEEIINQTELADHFTLNKKKGIYGKLIPAYKKSVYAEPFYHFDKKFFESKKKVFLKGGWQSEKYFQQYSTVIKDIFRLKEEHTNDVKTIAGELKGKETVAIHIRRGDYLRKKIIHEWHGVMEKGYYLEAMNLITREIKKCTILYFTDDPGWVNKELSPSLPGEIVSGNISRNHFEDLYLMSRCRHNIIANSSFSWWSAWLNDNSEKMVIAPKKWFDKGPKDTQDIIPAEWYKI